MEENVIPEESGTFLRKKNGDVYTLNDHNKSSIHAQDGSDPAGIVVSIKTLGGFKQDKGIVEPPAVTTTSPGKIDG